MKKDAIRVTFAHKVTRDELIDSLDRILHIYGCPNCGLNGWGGFHFEGDPEPFISQVRTQLVNEQFKNVVNVETFQAPAAQIRNIAGLKEAM